MEHKPLKEYWSKRDFKITSEPKGKVLAKEMDRFVVQEHWASHHHFDFRLEMDGVLKSWAVPKGIPYKKGLKRLAVQTEDHPISYIDFEGEIPEGQYGAGVVKIFDKGKYKLIRRNEKNLVFKLEGERIRGEYSLLKFKEPNQWLIFKSK